MTTYRILVATLAAAALGACATPSTSSQSSERAPPPAPPEAQAGTEAPQGPGMAGVHGQPAAGRMLCPMALPGTRVSASDTEDGAALTFTTSGDVDELRQRVREAGAHHARMADAHAGMAGHAGMDQPPATGAGTGAGGEVRTRDPAQDEIPAKADPEHAGTGDASASGTGMGAGTGCCGPGMAHQAMMTADARAEDVDGGARLVLTPKDAAGADALRAEVREHAARMSQGGGCPMSLGG